MGIVPSSDSRCFGAELPHPRRKSKASDKEAAAIQRHHDLVEQKIREHWEYYNESQHRFLDREHAFEFLLEMWDAIARRQSSRRSAQHIVPEGTSLEEILERAFEAMDVDGDGRISYEDFRNFILNARYREFVNV
eukprot:gb/GECH01003625.1/.p1 GENE.gb/GECH01003625.1/~~gb/GECH01003625.1/.p1  ORF type:complete len:135 (+),score=37.04 gb/GECH01003625.1/:1-405(+)